jgi:hypothetical protein
VSSWERRCLIERVGRWWCLKFRYYIVVVFVTMSSLILDFSLSVTTCWVYSWLLK